MLFQAPRGLSTWQRPASASAWRIAKWPPMVGRRGRLIPQASTKRLAAPAFHLLYERERRERKFECRNMKLAKNYLAEDGESVGSGLGRRVCFATFVGRSG